MALNDVIKDELNSGKMPNLIDMRKTSWTLSEILDTEFPEPKWIVPSIVQEGLVMLAGRPKAGKSWMALQLAGAVDVSRRPTRELQAHHHPHR